MPRRAVLDWVFYSHVALAYTAWVAARNALAPLPLFAFGLLVALAAGTGLLVRAAARRTRRSAGLLGAGLLVVAAAVLTAPAARNALEDRAFWRHHAALAEAARAALAQAPSMGRPRATGAAVRSGAYQAGYARVSVAPDYVAFTRATFIDMERGVLWVRPGHAAPSRDRVIAPDRLTFRDLRPLGQGWYAYAAD